MNNLQLIQIHYGPTFAHHTFTHRPQKLAGIKEALQRSGYQVELIRTDIPDQCIIKLGGHEVFRCYMKSLLFNMPIDRDKTAKLALEAIEDGYVKLARGQTYVWVWNLIEDQTFERIENHLKSAEDTTLECGVCYCHVIPETA